jgi:hypothetical protein
MPPEPFEDYDNAWVGIEPDTAAATTQTPYQLRQERLDTFWDDLRPLLLDYTLSKDDPLYISERRNYKSLIVVTLNAPPSYFYSAAKSFELDESSFVVSQK